MAFDEAFFNGDRRAILQACADKARAIKPKDAKFLAEYGRAYLAALDRPKAEAAFKEAEDKEPKDGQVLRLIAVAWLKNGYKTEALEGYEKIVKRDPKNKEAVTQAAIRRTSPEAGSPAKFAWAGRAARVWARAGAIDPRQRLAARSPMHPYRTALIAASRGMASVPILLAR